MEGWWVEVSPFCTCLNLKPLHRRELPAAGGWVLGRGVGSGIGVGTLNSSVSSVESDHCCPQ